MFSTVLGFLSGCLRGRASGWFACGWTCLLVIDFGIAVFKGGWFGLCLAVL